MFESAQGYVMLGRQEKLEQLFIVEKVDKSKLYSYKTVREEHEKMNERSINENPPIWERKE